MKKIIFSTLAIAIILISCNQKNKETSKDETPETTKDATTIAKDSAVDGETKTIDSQEKMYSCSMHPEVQGKMDEKCSKCGMKLIEPVEKE